MKKRIYRRVNMRNFKRYELDLGAEFQVHKPQEPKRRSYYNLLFALAVGVILIIGGLVINAILK